MIPDIFLRFIVGSFASVGSGFRFGVCGQVPGVSCTSVYHVFPCAHTGSTGPRFVFSSSASRFRDRICENFTRNPEPKFAHDSLCSEKLRDDPGGFQPL